MVLGHIVDFIVDQGQCLLDVLLDVFIELLHGAALIVGANRLLGFGRVRQTHIGVGRLGVVGITEHVGEQEVSPGTAHQRLTSLGTQTGGVAHLLDGLQSVVGMSHRTITCTPKALGCIRTDGRDVLPAVGFLLALVFHRILHTIIHGVVGCHLLHHNGV